MLRGVGELELGPEVTQYTHLLKLGLGEVLETISTEHCPSRPISHV
jgi:hypothetical protein